MTETIAEEVSPVEQFIPNERRVGKGKEEASELAELTEATEDVQAGLPPQDSTSDGAVNPLRYLALSVMQQAIHDGARDWFFSRRTRDIFHFWCRVSELEPGWVQHPAAAV